MRRLTSIVALNQQGVIGVKNTLPWRLKTDLAFFKRETTGNVVIMGRKTFDSLGRKPLAGRFNIIVSHEFRMFPPETDCVGVTGIGEALVAAEAAPKRYREIFVVGGQTMYEQFSDIVDRYLLTIVRKDVPDGDTFFDSELIGDETVWQQKSLASNDAVEGIDEAAFDIIELSRPRTDEISGRRAAMMSQVRPKQETRSVKREVRSASMQPALGGLF